jgi:serine/threonine-protein phosphatase 2A regulatory subunit B'
MTPIGPKQPREGAPIARERSPSPSIKSLNLSEEASEFLVKKLSFCSQPLSIHDSEAEKRDRRRFVQEITSLLLSSSTIEQFINPRLAAIWAMIESTLFRPLKKLSATKAGNETMDKAEQDQLDDPSWTVISPVYNLHSRLLENESVNQKTLKSLVSPQFIQKYIELFDSEYPPEREVLKNGLHLMYLKHVGIRKTVRKVLNELFYRVIHENYRFNGLSELLEIMASIISGFSVPIKEEHLMFFDHVILPLHKVQTAQLFHQELMRCTMLFVEKDSKLGLRVIEYLEKVWPKFNSSKEVKFMEEMMMVAFIVDSNILKDHIIDLFKLLSRMLASQHFKICDFALSCFEKSDMMALVKQYKSQIYPLIVPAAERASQEHWQATISSSLIGLLAMLEQLDPSLFAHHQGKAVLHPDRNFGNAISISNKEQIWSRIYLEAQRCHPEVKFSLEPYRTDHLVGDYNGVNTTNGITPEIS